MLNQTSKDKFSFGTRIRLWLYSHFIQHLFADRVDQSGTNKWAEHNQVNVQEPDNLQQYRQIMKNLKNKRTAQM